MFEYSQDFAHVNWIFIKLTLDNKKKLNKFSVLLKKKEINQNIIKTSASEPM